MFSFESLNSEVITANLLQCPRCLQDCDSIYPDTIYRRRPNRSAAGIEPGVGSNRRLPVITESGRQVGFDRGSSVHSEKRLSPVSDCHTSPNAEDRPDDEYGERVLSDGRTKIYDPKNDAAWIISDTVILLRQKND